MQSQREKHDRYMLLFEWCDQTALALEILVVSNPLLNGSPSLCVVSQRLFVMKHKVSKTMKNEYMILGLV